jgi:hypothetical protein
MPKNPSVKVTVEGNELVIRLPLNDPPTQSASKKNRVHASTRGNLRTDVVIDGKRLTVGVNAYTAV